MTMLIALLLAGHVAALVFGLLGMLVAMPNPQLWAASPFGVQVYRFGMQFAGSLHIVLGAAAMLAFGARALGWRKTAIFFVCSTLISLGSELLGTGTGWPFGAYEYTDGLGWKVLGRVPFSIPLSWFYMGLAAYLLAIELLAGRVRAALPGVVLGAWLLLVWDLVLDPAMAHESLPLKFWLWHESGPYFGMPVKNLAAWFLTGLAYISLSRRLWRADPPIGRGSPAVPLAVYLANSAFAAVLSASVGLWQPILLAALLGGLPALTLLARPSGGRRPVGVLPSARAGQ